MSPDHQVAALLFLAGLIGAAIWTLRCIDTWAARRHAEVLAAMRRHPAGSARPEFERSPFGLTAWTDTDDQAVATYLADLPYDHERDGL